jgi:hypothetical protein
MFLADVTMLSADNTMLSADNFVLSVDNTMRALLSADIIVLSTDNMVLSADTTGMPDRPVFYQSGTRLKMINDAGTCQVPEYTNAVRHFLGPVPD